MSRFYYRRLSFSGQRRATETSATSQTISTVMAAAKMYSAAAIGSLERRAPYRADPMPRPVIFGWLRCRRNSDTAKAPAHENQRLCVVPHTCRFLGQQSSGSRTGVRVVPAFLRGRLVRPKKHIPRVNCLKRHFRGYVISRTQSFGLCCLSTSRNGSRNQQNQSDVGNKFLCEHTPLPPPIALMSALGQRRTLELNRDMSALCQKEINGSAGKEVLFDYLVGSDRN